MEMSRMPALWREAGDDVTLVWRVRCVKETRQVASKHKIEGGGERNKTEQ